MVTVKHGYLTFVLIKELQKMNLVSSSVKSNQAKLNKMNLGSN